MSIENAHREYTFNFFQVLYGTCMYQGHPLYSVNGFSWQVHEPEVWQGKATQIEKAIIFCIACCFQCSVISLVAVCSFKKILRKHMMAEGSMWHKYSRQDLTCTGIQNFGQLGTHRWHQCPNCCDIYVVHAVSWYTCRHA